MSDLTFEQLNEARTFGVKRKLLAAMYKWSEIAVVYCRKQDGVELTNLHWIKSPDDFMSIGNLAQYSFNSDYSELVMGEYRKLVGKPSEKLPRFQVECPSIEARDQLIPLLHKAGYGNAKFNLDDFPRSPTVHINPQWYVHASASPEMQDESLPLWTYEKVMQRFGPTEKRELDLSNPDKVPFEEMSTDEQVTLKRMRRGDLEYYNYWSGMWKALTEGQDKLLVEDVSSCFAYRYIPKGKTLDLSNPDRLKFKDMTKAQQDAFGPLLRKDVEYLDGCSLKWAPINCGRHASMHEDHCDGSIYRYIPKGNNNAFLDALKAAPKPKKEIPTVIMYDDAEFIVQNLGDGAYALTNERGTTDVVTEHEIRAVFTSLEGETL